MQHKWVAAISQLHNLSTAWQPMGKIQISSSFLRLFIDREQQNLVPLQSQSPQYAIIPAENSNWNNGKVFSW